MGVKAGSRFVDFALPSLDGGLASSLAERSSSLLLALYYKVNCPTCQLVAPYVEKLHQAYVAAGLTVWGVSQNPAQPTAEFARRYGLSFTQLLDEGRSLVSTYEMPAVPALYLTDASGDTLFVQVSWNRDSMNALSGDIASRLGVAQEVIVDETDRVIAFQPG